MIFPNAESQAPVQNAIGASINAQTGAVTATVELGEDFTPDAVIEIILANASTDTNVVDFDLFVGAGATPSSLPSGFTVTSPFGSLADLRDYIKNVPCQVAGLQLDTNDATNNYAGNIKIGNRRPNNTMEEKTIRLSKFRVNNGGGQYQNVLDVDNGDQNFTLSTIKRMRFSHIHFGSSLIVRLTIPRNHRSHSFQDIKY